MIMNPIIPVWLMSTICFISTMIILFNGRLRKNTLKKQDEGRTKRQKKLIKDYILNSIIKISIVILLFIINLRFMFPNGETISMSFDVNVLFVIDKSVSMKALDYDGEKERLEGVVNDCCYIVDELSGCKFSIITFGETAQKLIPFTTDTGLVQSQLKALSVENDLYATGTSINLVKDVLHDTLKKQEGASKTIVFFVSDGEITKEGETLKSFSSISQYIYDGAIMGYGTTQGGKMKSIISTYDYYKNSNLDQYMYYYDEKYNKITSISKIDETNLKQLSNDLQIDYVLMNKTSNIKYKINNIKQYMANLQTTEEKTTSYSDIYYYFAIPLLILLIIDLIIKKRRMQ